MPFNIHRYNAGLDQFAIWSGAFTKEEVDQIKFLGELQEFQHAKVGMDNQDPRQDVRDSNVSWLNQDAQSQWVFERFGGLIPKINHDKFMLNIEGFERFQYTVYEPPGGHYNWHWDTEIGIWSNYIRKISCVMMLSDPDEYEGGELEICNKGNFDDTVITKPMKGDVVFFGSWMPHRVRPVTSGSRKSLVCWVMGKREC